MNNFLNWLKSLFIINQPVPMNTSTPETSVTLPKTEVPVEETTAPISVVYDPTPAIEPIQPTKLELWMKSAIAMEGANPAHNNPGNIRYVPGTWMQKMAIGESGGFCVFKDYETGYAVLKQFFTNAATGKSQIYHPTDTLYGFYSKYAPVGDDNNPLHYSQVVASEIATVYPGVTNQTVISTLV